MNGPATLVGNVTNQEHQPDLAGNLFPVSAEVDDAALEITGQIPQGLRGSFVRNGPNPAFQPTGRYHMFDGDGMLHAITFDGEGAAYRNRWIRSRESPSGHAPGPEH